MYYFACLLDVLGKGRVVTVDISRFPDRPRHPRITYIRASSTSEMVANRIKENIIPGRPVLVILDSKHTPDYVLRELEIYSKYVTKGSYLIVEDTNLGGNPILLGKNGGPMTAVKKFLEKNKDFVADREWERFRVTSCPNGFLRREM